MDKLKQKLNFSEINFGGLEMAELRKMNEFELWVCKTYVPLARDYKKLNTAHDRAWQQIYDRMNSILGATTNPFTDHISLDNVWYNEEANVFFYTLGYEDWDNAYIVETSFISFADFVKDVEVYAVEWKAGQDAKIADLEKNILNLKKEDYRLYLELVKRVT